MNSEEKQSVANQIKASSFFVVASLSPSFLISLICVFLYLFTVFPELKEPVSSILASLLLKAGIKTSSEVNTEVK
jgi:hypothetical protein